MDSQTQSRSNTTILNTGNRSPLAPKVSGGLHDSDALFPR